MRPLIQPWHAAITQAAPLGLEEIYLCTVLSFDIPLRTTADIGLDETILIGGDDIETVQRLGFDDKDFNESYDARQKELVGMFEHHDVSMFLNVLLTSADVGVYSQFLPIADRLEVDEYLWVRMEVYCLNRGSDFTIQGFLRLIA
jgi:hypothetical protein